MPLTITLGLRQLFFRVQQSACHRRAMADRTARLWARCWVR